MNSEKENRPYTLFDDDPNGATLREIDSPGSLMSIGQFFENCIKKGFMDYDGRGYFVIEVENKKYEITDIHFGIDDDDEVYYKGEFIGGIFYICNILGILEIMWYNK